MAEVNIYSGSSISEFKNELVEKIKQYTRDVADISAVLADVKVICGSDAKWLLSDRSCPKCERNTVVHTHKCVGGAEYYDRFTHTCANPACDYKDSQDIYGGQDGNIDNKCPFCNTESK